MTDAGDIISLASPVTVQLKTGLSITRGYFAKASTGTEGGYFYCASNTECRITGPVMSYNGCGDAVPGSLTEPANNGVCSQAFDVAVFPLGADNYNIVQTGGYGKLGCVNGATWNFPNALQRRSEPHRESGPTLPMST